MEISRWVESIVHAITLLHCVSLQLQNVLVKQGNAKLADFAMSPGTIGQASVAFTNRSSTAATGTDAYSAPEVIEFGRRNLSAASDMFSFAMLLYHVVEEMVPWGAESSAFIVRQVKEGRTPPLNAAEWTPELMELTTVCWMIFVQV